MSVVVLEEERLLTVNGILKRTDTGGRTIVPYVETKGGGELAGRGYFLDSALDWVIVRDTDGAAVLVPMRRS